MFRKKTTHKYIMVYCGDHVKYDGKWEELPFAENVVIDKSIEFFDEPAPCYIHQNAVQIRLLAELEKTCRTPEEEQDTRWLSLLSEYMGIPSITKAVFSEK